MDRLVKEEMVLGHLCMLEYYDASKEYKALYNLRVERDDGSAVIEVRFSKQGDLLPYKEDIGLTKPPATKQHFKWVIWAQSVIEQQKN